MSQLVPVAVAVGGEDLSARLARVLPVGVLGVGPADRAHRRDLSFV